MEIVAIGVIGLAVWFFMSQGSHADKSVYPASAHPRVTRSANISATPEAANGPQIQVIQTPISAPLNPNQPPSLPPTAQPVLGEPVTHPHYVTNNNMVGYKFSTNRAPYTK